MSAILFEIFACTFMLCLIVAMIIGMYCGITLFLEWKKELREEEE